MCAHPVIVGITNRESATAGYTLVLTQNNSSGSEQQLDSQRVTLSDNSTWQKTINIQPTVRGGLK